MLKNTNSFKFALLFAIFYVDSYFLTSVPLVPMVVFLVPFFLSSSLFLTTPLLLFFFFFFLMVLSFWMPTARWNLSMETSLSF